MNRNKEADLKLMTNLRDKERDLKIIFDKYINYIKMYSWIGISIFVVIAIIGIYTMFFAGNRYSISDHNTIKYTMATIMGVIACFFMVMAIVAFRRQNQIRILVKNLALSENVIYKDLKKEINIILKSSYGGPGI